MDTDKLALHVVGNRPQFIKLAPLSKELHKRGYQDMVVHTGQHYDNELSAIFFEELGIKQPEINLHIGSGTHAEMTSKCMIGLEKVYEEKRPSIVIVYGDTDSTLAAAITAAKMGIPICHIEAGPRTYKANNPEEQNRVMVDHISTLLFAPDEKSFNNLKKEGVRGEIYQSGDIMLDTFKKNEGLEFFYELEAKQYVLMTWHRQENTNSRERMEKILRMIEKIPYRVVCPMHPRTKAKLIEYELWDRANSLGNFDIIKPVGYGKMISLMKNSRYIVTDSGGASKESCYAGVKCLFFVELDIWTILEAAEWIIKVDVEDDNRVAAAIKKVEEPITLEQQNLEAFFGTGKASEMIVDALENHNYI